MESSTWANIFQKEILTDHATIKYMEDEYRTPNSDVSAEPNIVIESRAIGAETFVLPSRAYLLVKAKIKKGDDSNFTADDNIALVNGWQSFRKVEMYMNGTLVNQCDYPGYVDTILGLIDDEKDYDTKGSLEYRYYDNINGKVAVADNSAGNYFKTLLDVEASVGKNDAGAVDLDNYLIRNHAQVARVARSSLGAGDFWFKLPLRNVLGLCKVDKPLRGIQLQLRLTKETEMVNVLLKSSVRPAGILNTVGTDTIVDGKLVISKVSLMMPSAKPHIDVFKDLNDRLRTSEPIPLDYQRIWCNFFTNKTGASVTERLMSNSRRPRHVFLGIQIKDRHKDQKRNPLIFDLPASVVGHVRVGNQAFPAVDYNSENDGFIRMYNAFLDAGGRNIDRSSNSFLTFDLWKKVYPIFYFDCSANDNQFELQQDAEIVCNLTIDGLPTNVDSAGEDTDQVYRLVAIVISDEHIVLKEEGSAIMISTSDK